MTKQITGLPPQGSIFSEESDDDLLPEASSTGWEIIEGAETEKMFLENSLLSDKEPRIFFELKTYIESSDIENAKKILRDRSLSQYSIEQTIKHTIQNHPKIFLQLLPTIISCSQFDQKSLLTTILFSTIKHKDTEAIQMLNEAIQILNETSSPDLEPIILGEVSDKSLEEVLTSLFKNLDPNTLGKILLSAIKKQHEDIIKKILNLDQAQEISNILWDEFLINAALHNHHSIFNHLKNHRLVDLNTLYRIFSKLLNPNDFSLKLCPEDKEKALNQLEIKVFSVDPSGSLWKKALEQYKLSKN